MDALTEPAPRKRRFRLRHGIAACCLMLLLSYGWSMADTYSGLPHRPRDCVVRQAAAPLEPDRPPSGPAGPSWLLQAGGTVNDASCLNRTAVYGVARPATEADLRTALAFATEQGLRVSLSGTRHSMGGQAADPGALVVDLRGFDRIAVDTGAATARVGAGVTWRQVLEAVHGRGLAVAAMPSIDVLSVGGTIAANAHGADFRTGSLASTVRSLRVMLADGSVHTLDREHRPDLFHAVIGGYGLLGVIVEAELALVPGELYRLDQRVIATTAFPDHFRDHVQADESTRLMYAHLSTSPDSLLAETVVYSYRRVDDRGEPVPPLRSDQDSAAGRFLFNLARHGGPAMWLKWAGQRDLLPRVRQCQVPRNEALRAAEACLVSRNQAMYNDLALLRHKLPQHTDVLQEYFLPHDRLVPFLQAAAETLRAHDAVLMNASIRVVHAEPILLDYAQGERFSVVLYLSQRVSDDGNRDMADLTRALVAGALEHGGTFYLPYQQHYTRTDVARAYPALEEFFALKRRHDPGLLFMNGFYRRYA